MDCHQLELWLLLGQAGGRRPSTVLYSEARRENAQQRDFTVNGLLFDPFSGVLYDYVGGVLDCKQRTLRTIEKADASFRDDPARILRAVRHASRAGQQNITVKGQHWGMWGSL